jgi:hypothetical protein
MMTSAKALLFRLLAIACAAACAFFTFFGVQVVYASLTFEGEGSLGHVGMYIGAFVFPLLAFLFGGFTYLAWRKVRAT